jgi:competence protein ComEC
VACGAARLIRLRYGDRSILLPGDAEKQVEYAILEENDSTAVHADVLKVGHHGSKNSTMPEFLSAVSPQIAIISAGEENPMAIRAPNYFSGLRKAACASFAQTRKARCKCEPTATI